MSRIILLDLNYTLVENSQDLGYPHHNRLHLERYRRDLWLRIKDEFVILITVRPIEFKDATLERINAQLGWQPNAAFFNEWAVKAPVCKRRLLMKYVFPRFGNDVRSYFALESNEDTRAMYATAGIEAKHYREFMGIGSAPGKRPAKIKDGEKLFD